jgi:tetratricopeptide (TPR) repeat protein
MRGLFLTVLLGLLLLGSPQVVQAEGQKASNRTYLKLMDVQELWNEEQYSEALELLRNYEERVIGDPYDQALVLQYVAHTHIFLDQIEGSRAALERALALDGIDTPLTADLKLIYGQILMGDDDFEKALVELEFWYENTELEKPSGQVFTLGYANFMNGRLERAEELVNLAIATDLNPSKSWSRLYYQILFELKRYPQAEEFLLGMIDVDPYETDNWRLLANHYLQLEDRKAALTAVTIAYNAGLLEDAVDLKRMIALYSAIEIPEKAARLLELHLEDGSLEPDPDVLKRLADLWMLSREREQAKVALQRAATVAPNGRTYEMLGNIFYEDEAWEEAYESYLKAIELGGLDEIGRVYLLAGLSAEAGGNKDAAREAFREARKSDELRRQADALLRRLDNRG